MNIFIAYLIEPEQDAHQEKHADANYKRGCHTCLNERNATVIYFYLEEILFDVSEDICILFEFLLLRTALALIFIVN
jgi:hypothetical protein